MSEPDQTLSLSFAPSMGHFDPRQWNALAKDAPPFMRWEWLDLLETTGAVSPETGWQPAHCALYKSGRLAAAAPLYIKSHGQGEFVYDQLWAEAASRLGLPYYPKLVAASPFTPAAGYRFLTAEGLPRLAAVRAFLAAMDSLCQARGLTGLHILFTDDAFAARMEKLTLTAWEHQGFIWTNQDYKSFQDFLTRFTAGGRKSIRRERERLRESGIRVEMVEGEDAPESWFSLMYRYYADTSDKFGEWGCKFLPRGFFTGLADTFREHVVFSAGYLPGTADPVGLAVFIKGADTLYGRYWGAARDIPFLHFELCYYVPIEWAIARKIKYFDPGMGGEHKPRRGFDSRPVKSFHTFQNPVLDRVFAVNVPRINALNQEYIRELQAMSAFKTQR